MIAIDGPATSGKSSTAALVARRLGWAQLDSGALYRALTLAALDRLGEEGRGKGEGWPAQRILALAEELPVRLVLADNLYRPEVAGVDVEAEIRSERVTARVSEVAAIPAVREWVNARQRQAVAEHPQGVVVDGRDIGTVVFHAGWSRTGACSTTRRWSCWRGRRSRRRRPAQTWSRLRT